MATLAQEKLNDALVHTFTVVALGAATKGYPVDLDTADSTINNVAAFADNAIGVALDTAVAGAPCRVALAGAGVVKCCVGTNGTTFGEPQRFDSGGGDGVTDATVGTGTNKCVVIGQALQTGTAGALVGVNLGAFTFTVGA